jgi:hypothetical protein
MIAVYITYYNIYSKGGGCDLCSHATREPRSHKELQELNSNVGFMTHKLVIYKGYKYSVRFKIK